MKFRYEALKNFQIDVIKFINFFEDTFLLAYGNLSLMNLDKT